VNCGSGTEPHSGEKFGQLPQLSRPQSATVVIPATRRVTKTPCQPWNDGEAVVQRWRRRNLVPHSLVVSGEKFRSRQKEKGSLRVWVPRFMVA
jgi:hypothetical protein